MQEKQSVWSSKWIFILAAIGAAAGLGNLWRFPYMVYENGGGAFLLAYVIILFLLGIPLLIMEVAFGQHSQTDITQALKKVGGKFGKFIGWTTIMLIVMLCGYYGSVIAWGFDFLAASPTLAWGDDAQKFFHQNILQLSSGPETFGSFSIPIIAGLIATYIAVYFSIFKGIKSVGAVVKWTVPLPFILLFILFINSLTLDGASQGFAYFLIPDWSKLLSVELWKNAVSQAFFSMNIGLAATILYASYNKKKEKIIFSSIAIALGDALISIIAGFAMFGTLGYMALSQSLPITEIIQSGPTLAFVTFPTALSTLPIAPEIFAIIFFLSILTLAIDSMFALLETVSASIRNEFQKIKNLRNEIFIAIICITFFTWSVLGFSGGNGLYRLDILDHFLFSHLFYLIIISQVILIGWFFPAKKLRHIINENATFQLGIYFDYLIKFIAPAIFAYLYLSTLPKELAQNYEGYSSTAILHWGIIPCIICIIISAILAFRKK